MSDLGLLEKMANSVGGMSFQPLEREIGLVVPELKDLEDSELHAKLRELVSVSFHAKDAHENARLRHELQIQKIQLEIHKRELDAAQKERDHAQTRFAALYDVTPLAYATFDELGGLREINLAGAALLGLERHQLINSSFCNYLASNEIPRFLAHIDQVLDSASGQIQSLDIGLRNAVGRSYDVRLFSVSTGMEGDRSCLSAIIDVTEQSQIEQQMQRRDDFGLSVLSALPAQIAVLDGNGSIIAINDAWRRFAGEDDAPSVVQGDIGMDYLQCYFQYDDDSFKESPIILAGIKAVMSGTQPDFKLEYPSHTPGKKRWFLVWITPMIGQTGGVVVAHIDITARVLADENARKRGEALAHAARLSSVGILASAMAHEITQPLTSVGQFSSTAIAMIYNGEAKPQELVEVLLQIDSEVQRAGEVMRRLRAFMGHGDTIRLPVDLNKIADSAIRLVRQKAIEKRVDVILDTPGYSLDVVVDKVQLTQVLVNLIYNSIEAIDRASSPNREVFVCCKREDGWIHVRICDTGPGFDPKWRETIFDLFETDKANRIGMGLAISRSIIESHGGKIWAEPEAGGGAVFQFTLPIKQEEMNVE